MRQESQVVMVLKASSQSYAGSIDSALGWSPGGHKALVCEQRLQIIVFDDDVPLNAYTRRCPIACSEPRSHFRGTQTRMVVPQVSFDSIAIVPFTSRTRSPMLMSPSPPLIIATSASKPIP